MIRDQCKAYCQCSYCANNKERQANVGTGSLLPKKEGCSKDELYLRTLNESLRAKSLMASSKNAHRFKPDEMLQSTRGDMARAALTVPVRRRDRLQELLILENKERTKLERQLRRDRLQAGLTDYDDEYGMRDQAISAQDDLLHTLTEKRVSPSETAAKAQPVCSAEEDLQSALQTIKKITDAHPTGAPKRPLSTGEIRELRRLVETQDEKTKKMLAGCTEQPHACNHCFSINAQGKHPCVVPPQMLLKDSQLPSIHGTTTRRFVYNPHPYGSGVVWLPLEEAATAEKVKSDSSSSSGSSPASEREVANEYQYPGSTYNQYKHKTGAPTMAAEESGRERGVEAPLANGDVAQLNGTATKKDKSLNGKNGSTTKGASTKEPLPYKSSAALWRTTNQDRAAQMQSFLDFKKMHADASRVYAESAVRRPAERNTADTTSPAVAATGSYN
ncbi:uncharacterized protein TM35_000033020 [Trypanosoma theileri]|uniref:Uncharacterized protein n=1 Tax=Trypanosoma theileri TaxID=67003 RepID=A0A1X0P7K1_9TRYP|nr:uncharacterized protein TM35_000033020 [Trypanosoma theileri]ORC92549.1 hypothetical protein TM35_000033020 [Trypanosoma theileri]